MGARRPDKVDRDAAERLLNGQLADLGDDLTRLLVAVRAPAQPGELAGEEAAMDAFRSAHPRPVRQPRRGSMLGTALAKLLTLKVAGAAAAAALATGGVAVAAANGTLPNPLAGDKATLQPAPHSTGKPADAGQKDKVSPSPALEGLCRAYTAGVAESQGKALENPAFDALITTAGGKDQVAAYCDELLGEKGKPGTPPAGPADRPGGTHPTGKPDDQPGNKPTAEPGGERPGTAPTRGPNA